jgi:hypothetical protein
MAITDVSAAYKDAVCAFLKRLQNLMRSDCCGTERSYGPQIRWVLQTADSGKVRARVSAPVAQKADYGRFKLFVGHRHSI